MGVLTVPYNQIDTHVDLLQTMFTWLRMECKADFVNHWIGDLGVKYLIEGEGIPKDREPFTVNCTVLAKGVLMFEIE